ncbi:hypothetical protein Salat_2585400 [Sesamum alatum]|uniref:CCHC-type domain-containing protein n=1 Tax=Sesamum alatum TaxID=300844 RepID=A0AAE2CAH8_9LAMI|nr:hypothetical protein Salat_2585400 [Sesamum alatum]
MRLRSPSGEELSVSFMYEKLPTFCYVCGVLGHIVRDCIQRFGKGEEPRAEDDLPYGPWLREMRTGGYTTVRGVGSWGSSGGGWRMERESFQYRTQPSTEGGDEWGEVSGDRGGVMGVVKRNVRHTGRESGRTGAEEEVGG